MWEPTVTLNDPNSKCIFRNLELLLNHIGNVFSSHQLGKLKMAWDDLNQAILLEPMLLDAYWHRHLLYLLRNKSMKALHDLNSILKINKEHVGAYRSR